MQGARVLEEVTGHNHLERNCVRTSQRREGLASFKEEVIIDKGDAGGKLWWLVLKAHNESDNGG